MLGRYTTGPLQRMRRIAGAGRVVVPPRAPQPTRGRAADARLYSPSMDLIDLRSDTVTKPTDEMRRAMATAEVGDDVFGDDPTVIALEERAAELLGKEAGLFVSSGTQGNLVAQLAHLARGQETIAAASSHMVMDEAAGHAVIVGTSIRTLRERPGRDGRPGRDRRRVPRPDRSARADQRARHDREHPRPLDGPATVRRRTPPRSGRSPIATASRSTSTVRGSSTPSSRSG